MINVLLCALLHMQGTPCTYKNNGQVHYMRSIESITVIDTECIKIYRAYNLIGVGWAASPVDSKPSDPHSTAG